MDFNNVGKGNKGGEKGHKKRQDRLELERRIEARAAFQDDWLQKFDWLVYNDEEAKLYYFRVPYSTSLYNDDKACVEMVYCIALAVSSVAKNSGIAITLEKLVNSIATHFNHSNKRLDELRITQKDFACPILRLEHTFDVSKLFQKEFVDVTTMSAIIQKEINLIQQYYIGPPDVDENELILDASGYTFLREYGPDKGFLFYLRGAIRGKKFFDIEIERDIFGMDLMRALEFQVSFSKKVIASLQERFVDNSILGKLGILVPAQHLILEKSLRDYGKSEAKEIASFYGKMKSLEIINSASLIDEDDFISEFRSFKQQAVVSWCNVVLMLYVREDLAHGQGLRQNYETLDSTVNKILLRFEETTNMNLNFLPKSIHQSRLSRVTVKILVLGLAQKCSIYCDRLSLFFIVVLNVTL
ncbi:hypothetical protein GOP47_0020003 [Adiantum capillus-veneris]|uniref:Uncharacterized protein n=1 Tax=Adiantum capillus-veneris TaxID=13818 RepID=A0A9D4UC55_ADICA|nr:hypothetical protein GOP47_0020003 [Adiantum capillus-veneris]